MHISMMVAFDVLFRAFGEKEFVGIALSGILHAVLYFLLLGLSPLTYWNFGKHFFNLLVWPDDPRQLVLEIGMAFAIGLMTIHMLINLVEKILRVVRIDWFLVVAIIHPATLIYLFPTKYTLHVFGVWFSAILISIKYEKRWLVATLGIVFVFLYANML
ncbi:hypothetical protein GCK72_018194 [Caenorhabditis remanei]|uniref:Uncharacterized protein n=1 Tax=Caenorhabditis remanei TaxID=31234 RepID=A0A6A5G9E5_CAERE|nr:hypothetical protein GCK72_018194 [Caenorhabditis remanei]KAF1751640.1 hypothetical protein GCK72_018194 [Caenorhabditis remanei]